MADEIAFQVLGFWPTQNILYTYTKYEFKNVEHFPDNSDTLADLNKISNRIVIQTSYEMHENWSVLL